MSVGIFEKVCFDEKPISSIPCDGNLPRNSNQIVFFAPIFPLILTFFKVTHEPIISRPSLRPSTGLRSKPEKLSFAMLTDLLP